MRAHSLFWGMRDGSEKDASKVGNESRRDSEAGAVECLSDRTL